MIRQFLFRIGVGATVVCLVVVPCRSAFGQGLPEIRLAAAPMLEVGYAGIDLHRVVGAGLSPSGELYIANAGSAQVLVVNVAGDLVRSIGRRGDGPGEFRSLAGIAVVHDTLVSYDAGLSRVVLHALDGSHLDTQRLPLYDQRPVWWVDALSAFRYVAISPEAPMSPGEGLRLDRISVLRVDLDSGDAAVLAMPEWQYIYTVADGPGVTRYNTPFLGNTLVAGLNDRVVVVPRDGSGVEVLDLSGASLRSTPLPISRRPFDRALVEVFRDSLLAATAPLADRFPGAMERIERTFGSGFPVPPGEHAPLIQAVERVGDKLWLQSIPERGEVVTRWYIFDPVRIELSGRITLPNAWTVLGGDATRVIIRVVDEFDVESVRVYSVDR